MIPRILITLVTLGLLAVCANAENPSAEDGLIPSPEPGWPQWRGPRRDGISDEKGLLQSWPEGGPKLLWKVDGLGKGWSSPIVVGDTLYITGDVEDDLVLYAFGVDGELRWKTTNGESWKKSYPGARAACAYSEGKLYHVNGHGRLVRLDARTGAEEWAVNVLDRFDAKNINWGICECLLVDGERVIVTPGGKKALVAALDKKTGNTVWTTPSVPDDRPSYPSPILFRYGGRRLIANCSGMHGFGIDADTGELLWRVPLKNRFDTNVATPIYGGGAVYYVTPYAELGRQYRLRPTAEGMTAEHAWTSPLDTVTGCGVLVGDTLYAAGYRKPKWWLAVDWKTGETKHELKDFTTAAAIYADGRLYVLDEEGNAGLLDPTPDALNVVGRFRLTEEGVRDAWAHPVLLDGRLYLRYHDSLWCYQVINQ